MIHYDVKCYELARAFLADSPNVSEDTIASLARDIQQAVEDWFFDQQHLEPQRQTAIKS